MLMTWHWKVFHMIWQNANLLCFSRHGQWWLWITCAAIWLGFWRPGCCHAPHTCDVRGKGLCAAESGFTSIDFNNTMHVTLPMIYESVPDQFTVWWILWQFFQATKSQSYFFEGRVMGYWVLGTSNLDIDIDQIFEILANMKHCYSAGCCGNIASRFAVMLLLVL